MIEQLFTSVSTAVRVQRAAQTIYQQCVLGDRETSAFVNEADAAPDDNSDLASGGHDYAHASRRRCEVRVNPFSMSLRRGGPAARN